MEILKKFILVLLMGFHSAEFYNWNMRPLKPNHLVEGEKDYNNEFKLQSTVVNDLQRDLLKISGKANENIYEDKDVNYGNYSHYYSDDPVEEEITTQEEYNWQDYGMKEKNRLSDNVEDSDASESLLQSLKAATKISDGSNNKLIQFLHDYEQFKRNDFQNINNDRQSYQGSSDDYPSFKYESPQMDSDNYNLEKLQNEVLNFIPLNGPNFQNMYGDNKHFDTTPPSLRDRFPPYDENSYFQNQTKYKYFSANNERSEDAYIDERQSQNDRIEKLVQNSEADFRLPPVSCPAKDVSSDNFHGSRIFDSTIRKCLSRDYYIILTIRKDFEDLLTNDLPQCLLDDKMVAILMNYFYLCHRLINSFATGEKKIILFKTLFDTLGGYLNFYLVPVAKFSFYAGEIGLETTSNILRLHQQCKNYLNTNGDEWKPPITDVLNELGDVSIEPLDIDEDEDINNPIYCMNLDMYKEKARSNNERMLVPLPKLEVTDDDTGQLGNIWLPFRRKRVYDLTSPSSAYVVVKYYENVSRCYLYESLKTDCYDRKFHRWIRDNLHNHLSDDAFYPGLGAVLRISERLRWLRNSVRDDSSVRDSGYAPEEMREKKSYETNRSLFNFKTQQKSENSENKTLFHDLNNLLDESKSQNSQSANRDQLSDEESRLADDALQVKAKRNETTRATSQHKYLNMTLTQWLIIVIPLSFLIIIGIVICCLSFRKKRKKSRRLSAENGKRKSQNLEEEPLLLNANSKSVVNGKNSNSKNNRYKAPPHLRSVSSGSAASSSSSLMCQLPAKCFTFKRPGPAIIETTSLDYSTSEGEENAKKKLKTKTVKIDEKSGKNKTKEPPTVATNGKVENDKETKK